MKIGFLFVNFLCFTIYFLGYFDINEATKTYLFVHQAWFLKRILDAPDRIFETNEPFPILKLF